jgi:hypothetical protein
LHSQQQLAAKHLGGAVFRRYQVRRASHQEMTLVTMYKRPVNPATKNAHNPMFSQKWPPSNADLLLIRTPLAAWPVLCERLPYALYTANILLNSLIGVSRTSYIAAKYGPKVKLRPSAQGSSSTIRERPSWV